MNQRVVTDTFAFAFVNQTKGYEPKCLNYSDAISISCLYKLCTNTAKSTYECGSGIRWVFRYPACTS